MHTQPADLDYYAVYASPRPGKESVHLCNVVARSDKHAASIAKNQGLFQRKRRTIHAIRIGRDGYARLLRQAGFVVSQ
jgi:hypothetical protein